MEQAIASGEARAGDQTLWIDASNFVSQVCTGSAEKGEEKGLKEDTFQLKHPFVQLKHISSIQKDDRFSEVLEMDYDTLEEFFKLLAPVVIRHREVHICCGDELAVRPLHDAILCLFARLAQTSARILDLDVEGEDREGTKIHVFAGNNEGVDEVDDIEVVAASKRSSSSSREGALVMNECGSLRARADFVAHAYDKAYIQAKQLPRFDEWALCTFLVVESKGNDLPKDWQQGLGAAALQAADYCIIEAFKNIQKGRKKPISFQGWSMYHWAYGELHVDEVVKLIDGRVYRVMEDGLCEKDATLQAVLSAQQVKLQEHLDDSNAEYPNGEYLIGTVYMSRQVLQFPTPTSLQVPNADIFRFIQGLLHLFLGKKVLKWKVEDAKRLVAAMVAEDAKLVQDEILIMGRDIYKQSQRKKRLRV